MRIQYKQLRFTRASEQMLEKVNGILTEYAADNYVLTLRQLYYQLVSRNIIRNDQKQYKQLGELLVKGRMAGVIDWESITDKGRISRLPYWVTGIRGALNDTVRQYRLDRMDEQETKIEVWVEKEALSNIFERVTYKYHVSLMVNKGYSSCSAMHDAWERLENQDDVLILYFGDHDPSGIDMARDIANRFAEFGAQNIRVERPALTMEQIRRFNCPVNPVKFTDSRTENYVKLYGKKCWELDALPPRELTNIIERSIRKNIDVSQYEAMLEKEAEEKKVITNFASKYK